MILLMGFLAILGFAVESTKPEQTIYQMKISRSTDSVQAAQDYCNEKRAEIIELGLIEGDSKTIQFKCKGGS